MRYRIAQFSLIILGLIFALATLAPISPGSSGGTAGVLGTIFGKLLVLFICIGCFFGARKAGINARKTKNSD
jgi:hypothetical protein